MSESEAEAKKPVDPKIDAIIGDLARVIAGSDDVAQALLRTLASLALRLQDGPQPRGNGPWPRAIVRKWS